MAVAVAALNLDPEVPGFVIKLIRLVVWMFGHCASLQMVTTQKGTQMFLAP